MLKSSELKKLWHDSNYGSHNLKGCSEVRSAKTLISFYFSLLRIGGPGRVLQLYNYIYYINIISFFVLSAFLT